MKKVTLIIFALLVLSGCSTLRLSESKTVANQLLYSFPNQITGAAVIQKLEAPNAKICLVHIMNMHGGEEATEDDWENIEKVQNSLSNMLNWLADNKILLSEEIFIESDGVKSPDSVDENNSEEDVRELMQKNFLRLKREGRELSADDFQDALKLILKKHRSIKRYAKINATKRFAEERCFRLMPAEDKDARKNAGKFLDYKTLPEAIQSLKSVQDLNDFIKAVFKDREDALIRNIANQSNSPLAITVFGGGHCLVDNINEWNNQNEDKRLSLIIIMPKNYPFEK